MKTPGSGWGGAQVQGWERGCEPSGSCQTSFRLGPGSTCGQRGGDSGGSPLRVPLPGAPSAPGLPGLSLVLLSGDGLRPAQPCGAHWSPLAPEGMRPGLEAQHLIRGSRLLAGSEVDVAPAVPVTCSSQLSPGAGWPRRVMNGHGQGAAPVPAGEEPASPGGSRPLRERAGSVQDMLPRDDVGGASVPRTSHTLPQRLCCRAPIKQVRKWGSVKKVCFRGQGLQEGPDPASALAASSGACSPAFCSRNEPHAACPPWARALSADITSSGQPPPRPSSWGGLSVPPAASLSSSASWGLGPCLATICPGPGSGPVAH